MKHLRLLTASSAFLALLIAIPVYAAGIDPAYKYAWSDQGGYVNFAPSRGGIDVTDTVLTGYAWAQNTGWISFDTIQSGVTNDGQGNLGGFAWSEGEGWLSFTGVSIDINGRFHGQATGADSTLTFDCTNCDVRTAWRADDGTTSGGNGNGSSGGSRNTNPSPSGEPSTPSVPREPSTPGVTASPATTGVNMGSGSPAAVGTSSTNSLEPTYPPSTGTQPTTPPPSTASTTEKQLASNLWIVLGIMGVFLLLVVILWLIMRRRQLSN